MSTPDMTRIDVARAIEKTIGALKLGTASVDWSSAYHDYIAITFYMAFPDERARAKVATIFDELCAAHGWKCLTVTASDKHRNIGVTAHRSPVISSADRRMP